jgi:hypothetical protein
MALYDNARRQDLIGQIPTDAPKAPASDGSQSNPLNSALGRNVANTLGALPGAAAVPGAAAAGTGLAARAFGAAAPAASTLGKVAQTASPYAPAAGGAAYLYSAASPATPPTPASGPTMMDGLRRQQSTAEEAAPAAPGLAAAAGLTPGSGPTGNVTRDGNSYSGTNIGGDITINGRSPGGSGPISAQNMAAANGLAQPRGLAERAGLTPGGGQRSGSPAVTGPTIAQALGFLPPTVRHSGNDWAARNALRNAEVSASSITNRGQRSSPSLDAYRAALANDSALQQAEPAMAQAAMRENAGLQREAMQQEGANGRTIVQAMQAQQRLAMDRETQGIVNRGKTIMQRLQEQIATEQDPTKRQSIAQRLREISGTATADPYLVVQGGQQMDDNGKAYNMPSRVFNRQKGEFVQQPRQGEVGKIESDSRAIAIKSDQTLSYEQKAEALRKLGYS